MFIITIYKDSRKVKISRNYVSKCNLYLYFLIKQNLLISGEKMLMSAELKVCVTWFIYFLDLLWVRYNCFIIVGYVWQILWRGSPHPWAAPKKPILNRVKDFFSKYDQIRRKLWIWSYLLKKSLMENFVFSAVCHTESVHLFRRILWIPW